MTEIDDSHLDGTAPPYRATDPLCDVRAATPTGGNLRSDRARGAVLHAQVRNWPRESVESTTIAHDRRTLVSQECSLGSCDALSGTDLAYSVLSCQLLSLSLSLSLRWPVLREQMACSAQWRKGRAKEKE
eukprot:2406144-Rhodomonas_salina.2